VGSTIEHFQALAPRWRRRPGAASLHAVTARWALTARRTCSCATSCGRPPRTMSTWCTEPASSTGTTWHAGQPRRAHARAVGCACCAAHAGCEAARLTPALHVGAAPQVLDLSGAPQDAGHAGRVRVTTSCVRGNLVAAGGMNGELAVANLEDGPGPAFRWRCAAPAVRAPGCATPLPCSRPEASAVWARSSRITVAENSITNGIEIFEAASGATRVMTSNNDACLRLFDAATFMCCRWARRAAIHVL